MFIRISTINKFIKINLNNIRIRTFFFIETFSKIKKIKILQG